MNKDLKLATKQAEEFLKPITNTPISELGQIFSNEAKTWYLTNQLNNLKKVQDILENAAIKRRKVPNKILFQYLEGVALEDDETLQEMWANLFVNYLDNEKVLDLTVYPHILKQLSLSEARIISFLYSNKVIVEQLSNILTIDGNRYKFTATEMSNLLRLGIVEEKIDIRDNSKKHVNAFQIATEYETRKSGTFYLTLFGYQFYAACTRDKELNL